MFDVLQVIFWLIAYLLIVIYGFIDRKSYKPGIPMFVALLNLGWEFNALIHSKGFWGHILWLLLDLFILALNIRIAFHKSKISGLIYTLSIIPIAMLFSLIFFLPKISGMFLSSFFLDLSIAIAYVLEAKKISHKGKLLISLTKLMGDLFAWIYYLKYSIIVAIIGGIVLTLNVYYLYYCVKEKSTLETIPIET